MQRQRRAARMQQRRQQDHVEAVEVPPLPAARLPGTEAEVEVEPTGMWELDKLNSLMASRLLTLAEEGRRQGLLLEKCKRDLLRARAQQGASFPRGPCVFLPKGYFDDDDYA